MNSIDVQSDTLTIRAVLPERDREPLKKYIGKDLQGFRFNISAMPEHHKMHFFSTQQAGKLVRVEENLHTIFFQQISQDSCDMIKKGLNLGESIYTIGLDPARDTFRECVVFTQKRRNRNQLIDY